MDKVAVGITANSYDFEVTVIPSSSSLQSYTRDCRNNREFRKGIPETKCTHIIISPNVQKSYLAWVYYQTQGRLIVNCFKKTEKVGHQANIRFLYFWRNNYVNCIFAFPPLTSSIKL